MHFISKLLQKYPSIKRIIYDGNELKTDNDLKTPINKLTAQSIIKDVLQSNHVSNNNIKAIIDCKHHQPTWFERHLVPQCDINMNYIINNKQTRISILPMPWSAINGFTFAINLP